MKLKKIGFTLGLASLALGGVAFVTSTGTTGAVKADAAEEPTAGFKYALEGTVSKPGASEEIGWGSGEGIRTFNLYFEWDPTDSHFEEGAGAFKASFDADKGDMFKIVVADGPGYTSSWEMNYDVSGIDGKCEYFYREATDNPAVMVNTPGTYTIFLADNFANYGDKAFGIAVESEINNAVVTYHFGDETLTQEAAIGTMYSPTWVFKEGYLIRGFYVDSDYTTAWPKEGIEVSGDLDVYVKTETAGPDYTIYYSGNYTNAYIWSDYANNSWPGTQMTKLFDREDGSAFYSFTVQSEYEAANIIFNGNTQQTGTIALGKTSQIYYDDGAHFSEEYTLAIVDFLDYWKTIRKDGDVYDGKTYDNSVCYLLNDDEAWDALKAKYDAVVGEEAKNFVRTTIDTGNYTIGTTYDYLAAAHVSSASAAGAPTLLDGGNDDLTIAIASIVGAMLLGVGAYFFLRKKKEAPRA